MYKRFWLLIFFFKISCSFTVTDGLAQVVPFSQVSEEANLNIALNKDKGTNGVALADYNGDNLTDIYIVASESYDENKPATWNRLLANEGDGTFKDVTREAGVAGNNITEFRSQMGDKIGASWGDYNNDGFPDLYLTHAGKDQLYHNNSDGTFTEVTAEAGIQGEERQVSSSALWFDYNNDGLLDLYVSVWDDMSSEDRDRRNRMYENIGDNNFDDISKSSGLDDSGFTWTTVALDVNNDGFLDLYLANDFGPNRLYINNGDGTFSENTEEFGLSDPFQGMGLAIGDPDLNGFFDIYLTNLTEMGQEDQVNPLFMNTGNNKFENRSDEVGVSLAGWGWGTEFFDFNNNGLEDLVVVNGFLTNTFENRFFMNTSTESSLMFEDVSNKIGFDSKKEARCIGIIDYNNDGRQDILVSNFTGTPSLYENNSSGGNWLNIELDGTKTNRSAYGSIVEVVTEERVLKKYHHGAQYLAQNKLPLHFGLEEVETVDKIIIHWLNGNKEVIENVPVNQTLYIKEGENTFTAIEENKNTNNVTKLESLGNYPNPFNGNTVIQFKLPEAGTVNIDIYNIAGQKVGKLLRTYSSGGNKNVRIQMGETTNAGSGIYFYRIQLKNNSTTGKMLYIK